MKIGSKIYISFVLFFYCAIGSAQVQYLDTTNLIPNPGFEEFSFFPLGWYYKGEHYSELVRFWTSPTGASPDAYDKNVIVPSSWKKNGFGETKPHTGKSMSGITLYGCENGKPHCREYLQVSLKEKLVPGQRYELVFYYSPLKRSLQIDRLGVVFVEEPIHKDEDVSLDYLNGQYLPEFVNPKPMEWEKYDFFFVAHHEAAYLIIGNFDKDHFTDIVKPKGDPLPFAYYYIDDVSLRKLPPIKNFDANRISLESRTLSAGLTIDLDNIYFDTDKTDFHPQSFSQLYELLQLMNKHTSMSIEVRGHTDDQGTDEYNQVLSNNRAKAVVDFLSENDIKSNRVNYKGYGRTIPIEDNATEEGRSQNRRVEFLILTM